MTKGFGYSTGKHNIKSENNFGYPTGEYTSEIKINYTPAKKEAIDHPDHYGGAKNPYEAIKVIRAWDLGFSLGNTVKYISRAGKKDPSKRIEDLQKALWYLKEEIDNELKRSTGPHP